jgi:hypothetical protein
LGKWESEVKLSSGGKRTYSHRVVGKSWKTSIRLSEKEQTVELQFGDGPRITMGLNDGVIRPQSEVGVGPEVAAIVSSLVVKGSPSGGEGHVKRRSASVLDGVRKRGINYSSASVPRVIGSESLQLAHSDPIGKKEQHVQASQKAKSAETSEGRVKNTRPPEGVPR